MLIDYLNSLNGINTKYFHRNANVDFSKDLYLVRLNTTLMTEIVLAEIVLAEIGNRNS